MNKAILSLLLVIVVMGVFVYASDEVRAYRFAEGWNLVYGFLSPSQLVEGSGPGAILENGNGGVTAENIQSIYVLVPNIQQYAMVYPDPSDEYIALLRSIDDDELVQMAFWVYSDKSGTGHYMTNDDVVPFGERQIYDGWNFVGLTFDLAVQPGQGETHKFGEILGSCSVERAYLFLDGVWFDIYENGGNDFEIDDDFLYQGLAIKASGDCKLGLSGGVVPPSIPTIPYVCTDSDGGKDYFVKGHLVDKAHNADYWDFCLDDTGLVVNEAKRLREHYCGPNNYQYNYYDCPNGCVDGACVE